MNLLAVREIFPRWRLALIALLCCAGGCTSRAAAFRRVFPSARKAAPAKLAHQCPRKCRISVIQGDTGAVGYAVEQVVVSRSGPFQIIVFVDTEFRVARADVVSYPGKRGREVQLRKFTVQFEGKGPDDPIRTGKDIDAVTGATISSRVMAGGVRHAVQLLRDKFGPAHQLTAREDSE